MLLLDSHVLLWVLRNEQRIGPAAREAIANAEGVHVSAASIWELTIKSMLGKLSLREDFATRVVDQGLVPLSVTVEHAEGVRDFPELTKHDPFDRLLVAQAHRAGLKLLTADRVLLAMGRDFIVDATR